MHDLIKLYKRESTAVFSAIDDDVIDKFVQMILDAYVASAKIYACGNGGNAAFVGNLITDLNIHPFVSDDKNMSIDTLRLHAINLCDSCETLTAIMNDIGSEYVFSEQLKFGGREGDLLIGITGSGTSKNIVQAIRVAKGIGMKTIVITKSDKVSVVGLVDLAVIVSGTSQFPGQTGKNNNNFHFEDCISKLSHIATGLLKYKVQGYPVHN